MRVDLFLSAFFGCLIGWFLLDEIVDRVKSSRFFKGSPNNNKRKPRKNSRCRFNRHVSGRHRAENNKGNCQYYKTDKKVYR